MTFLARLLGGCRFVKPQPAQSSFLYSWNAGDETTGFTRSGAVAYFDAAGVLRTAAENTPRIALDPLGGSGLLLEPAQDFGWSYTADFNQSGVWSKSFLTAATTTVQGPDRSTTVQKLVPTTSSVNSHRVQRDTPTATDDTKQTLIAVLRDAGYRYVVFTARTRNGAAFTTTVDVQSGTVVQKATGHEVHVLPLAEGFYAFWLTTSASHGAVEMQWRVAVQDSPVPNTAFAGDGEKGVYCALLQVAIDCDYATTPQPATTSAPSRGAESWVVEDAVTGSDVGKQGTIYEKYVDQVTGELKETVTVVTLTADWAGTLKRWYRAVKIALGARTLSEMQGDAVLPPTAVATSVTVVPMIAALTAGQSMLLSAAVRDQSGNAMLGESVTWASSNTDVATVSSAGLVTAVAEGTATITATSTSDDDLSAACTLTVNAAGTGYDYDNYPHSSIPNLLAAYVDFRTSYFPDSDAGNAQRETERQFIARHCDKSMSAGEPSGGYPEGFVHEPYILTSFVAMCVHDSTNWNDGRNKTDAIFEAWCELTDSNPEDGYLHYTTGSAPYKAAITSIDATGKVTLKYDFVTYTGGAIATGDTIVIEGCTPAALNGTWVISDVAAEGGDLDGNLDLRRAVTTFKIPHTGDVAVTKGTAALPIRGSERTKRNRLIFDVSGFPPPRWCINHAHPTRVAFEQYRSASMLTGGYGIGFEPEGFYVDELAENNIGKVAGKLCLEYAAGSADQFYTDMGTLYDAIGGSNRIGRPWITHVGTASYTSALTLSLIRGAKAAHLEQLGNTHIRFEWVPGASKFEIIRGLLREGVYLELRTPYTPADTIDGGQKPGSYAGDPVPAGCKAAANVRMMASVFCVTLLMLVTDEGAGDLAHNSTSGAWDPGNVNAGLNNRWLGLFEADLGAPTEEPARVVTGKTDSAGQGVTIAARRFERGLVAYRRVDVDYDVPTVDYAATYDYVPPTSSGASGLWCRVRSDGSLDTPRDTFPLASDEGVVLVPSDAPAPPPVAAAWYVATDGSSSNEGTSESPWSLAYALAGAGGQIKPDDTVWMKAGTYHNASGWESGSGLVGSNPNGEHDPAGKIHFRPDPAAAWRGVKLTDRIKFDEGSDFWLWDVDVDNTNDSSSQAFTGVDVHADRVKLIRVRSSNASADGMALWEEAAGSSAIECRTFYAGSVGNSPGGFAHGIYSQNAAGVRQHIHNHVSFGNTGFGFHQYTEEAHLSDMDLIGNIGYNDGTVSGYEFQVGGGAPVSALAMKQCWGYRAGTVARIGYTETSESGDVEDCLFLGQVFIENWSGADFTWKNNKVAAPHGGYERVIEWQDAASPDTSGWTRSGNAYKRVSGATGDPFTAVLSEGNEYSFAEFTDGTAGLGVETGSSFATGTDFGLLTQVRANDVDDSTATIVVHNPAGDDTADVDLSDVLAVDDSYAIYHDYDWTTAVVTGTYDGDPVTLPMTGSTPPTMLSGGTPPDAQPYFATFLLRKTS